MLSQSAESEGIVARGTEINSAGNNDDLKSSSDSIVHQDSRYKYALLRPGDKKRIN